MIVFAFDSKIIQMHQCSISNVCFNGCNLVRKLKQNRSLPDVIFSLSSQIDLNLGQVSINTTSASQVEICTCIGTGQCFLFPQTFDLTLLKFQGKK